MNTQRENVNRILDNIEVGIPVTLAELGTVTGMSASFLQACCKDGRLRAVRFGRIPKVPASEARRVLDEGIPEKKRGPKDSRN